MRRIEMLTVVRRQAGGQGARQEKSEWGECI